MILSNEYKRSYIVTYWINFSFWIDFWGCYSQIHVSYWSLSSLEERRKRNLSFCEWKQVWLLLQVLIMSYKLHCLSTAMSIFLLSFYGGKISYSFMIFCHKRPNEFSVRHQFKFIFSYKNKHVVFILTVEIFYDCINITIKVFLYFSIQSINTI